MGFMSQKYTPYCCFVYITEKKKYRTKIIKCDEELIIKDLGNVNIFKEKIEKGLLFEKDIYLYEKSQNGDEIYVWECESINKERFDKYVIVEKPIDIYFGIGQGRVYIEEGRFNTEDEGKRKLLDNNGYLIDNPNYKFREIEKNNSLFRYCKLG